jgi:hypothetical protein
VNCLKCPHKKSVPMHTTSGEFIKTRYFCSHPLQKSKTPWINRGHVLAKGTPDEPGEYGKCPLGCDLGFC